MTSIEKLDALLTQVLNVPVELSAKLCKELKSIPEESQKILLDAFWNKARKIKVSKENALQKIKHIKGKMIVEIEGVESKSAEKTLNESLKNI